MQLVIFNPSDDIREDGTATFWHIKESELNERYECSCIHKMLTTKELFDIVINQESVEIEPERVQRFCKMI